MQAVRGRAYPAALILLDAAKKKATDDSTNDVDRALLMKMIYPPGSNLDNSPLQVILGLWGSSVL